MRSFTRPITILLFLCLPLAAALAQPREINGRILDEKDEPLMGVNIRLAGAAGGTISDLEGRYSLRANDGERLIFTYVGYADEEVTVAGQRTIDVRMRPGAQLNEVVVAALGISREKKALGYAAQEVSGERLVAARQPNLLNALQGLAAGAQITSAGGGPGQGARIVIRGVNSLDPAANNQPLFVVDGVPIDNSTHSDGGGGRNLSNRLTDLNPDDIERISVLKGGAATALYGVRAANGAVIISTKRGQAGRLSVDFSSSATLEEVNKFPELQQTYTQGYRGEYDPNSFWPAWGPSIDDARREDPSHPPALFHNFRNAYRQGSQWRHHLSIAGGAQQASFRASIARLDHEGVIPFSNYRNTSLRFNGDIQANDKFSFGGGLNYVNSGGDRVSAQRFNERLVYWSPRVDVNDYQFPDGTMKG
jgi:TonB-dependent SusC/RagA subfamily outer membrane receptor